MGYFGCNVSAPGYPAGLLDAGNVCRAVGGEMPLVSTRVARGEVPMAQPDAGAAGVTLAECRHRVRTTRRPGER